MSQKPKPGSTAALNMKLDADPDAVQEQLPELTYEELQQRLVESEEKANQYWERLLRLQAEMDNMQRRVERDIANAHKYGLEKFIMELLPIIDGLERAVEVHEGEEAGAGSLLDGVKLTLKMLYAALGKFGIEQINPVLQPFNPEHHQAVSTVADNNTAPNTVVSVLQKGYLLNNRLIRPALVVVSKAA